MECVNCGRWVPDVAEFCPHCGARQPTIGDELTTAGRDVAEATAAVVTRFVAAAKPAAREVVRATDRAAKEVAKTVEPVAKKAAASMKPLAKGARKVVRKSARMTSKAARKVKSAAKR